MPGRSEFQYTILRLVPALDRGERINVGVIVFCAQLDFLAARVEVDQQRLEALTRDLQAEEVQSHLDSFSLVAAGTGPSAVASLPPSSRFGWLASPSSTSIQPSPVHTGLTHDPGGTLDHLFETLVRPGRTG